MSERPILVSQDVYAIFNDEARTVYFEKHLSATNRIGGKAPAGYEIPAGFMEIEAPKRWPTQSSAWVI